MSGYLSYACLWGYDDEKVYWFIDINANTGELCGAYCFSDIENSNSVSEEKCRSIADQFARKYIDLDEYTVETSNYTPDDMDEPAVYHFEYARVISGYQN